MISVHGAEKLGPDQMRVFWEASDRIGFVGEDRKRIYPWMAIPQNQTGTMVLSKTDPGT
jgi:hypothetical protein